MELRQLVYFDAVVRHGSFTKAAQRLHVAQPAVSAQIRRLEAELGATLLERTTRRVALTYAGELFLARARQVLDQIEGAHADLAELGAVRRGRGRRGPRPGARRPARPLPRPPARQGEPGPGDRPGSPARRRAEPHARGRPRRAVRLPVRR